MGGVFEGCAELEAQNCWVAVRVAGGNVFGKSHCEGRDHIRGVIVVDRISDDW